MKGLEQLHTAPKKNQHIFGLKFKELKYNLTSLKTRTVHKKLYIF